MYYDSRDKGIALHLQAAAVQQWRGTFWGYIHGSLTPIPNPPCQAFAEEAITFAWMRLSRALHRLTDAHPQLQQWPEMVHLGHVAQQMNQHLGLADGPPPKPLLWRFGGHPVQPASLRLCAMQVHLHQLCDMTRYSNLPSWRLMVY